MVTLKHVLKRHKELCNEARDIIEKKGHDYNREQQQGGDTLFNMSVCKILGITKTKTQGVLTRLADKFMRLNSLTKDLNVKNSVKDESIHDTIRDTINYLVYLDIFYEEEKNENSK